jgi:hypothetical protein
MACVYVERVIFENTNTLMHVLTYALQLCASHKLPTE